MSIAAAYALQATDARIRPDFRCVLPITAHVDMLPKEMSAPRTHYGNHLLLTAMIATWGGSFVVAKLAMQEVAPFALVATRFLLGSLCVLPFFLRALVRPNFRCAPPRSQPTLLTTVETSRTRSSWPW